ncbi:MAG: 50S ribosomal protein L25 [Candidatus Cloacimonetes bacterium]|nr:50S ribosomal protein L25 [Candidatus Cloacimonadota bacterium]
MNIVIEATEREIGTKSDLNELRKSNFIPGVIYGPGREPLSIKLDKNLFLKEYRKTIGELVIFNVKIGKKQYQTIIKDKQIHPVSREIQHLDFLELQKDSKIKVNVPIKFVGTPVGVKDGGVLETMIREIEITCLPKDLIEDIELDISDLEIGKSIQIGDLPIKDLEVSLSPEVSVVIVHPPKALVEEEVAEEEVTEEGEEAPEGEEETDSEK